MLKNFNELPETSRVWIYQSSEQLNEKQIAYIEHEAARFCDQWAAHGVPLQSAFKVLHEKFLILAVDEGANAPSGCSIDTSVRFVKTIEGELKINFFDRSQVAFLIDNHVYTTDLGSIKNEISDGKIAAETLTFNIQAQNLAEFNQKWLLPVQESWMKRYF
jgi:hypothetical protein